MKSFARSQSARRRAAATAAFASVGAGILGTHSAEAAIVTIDIGPSGFNIEGVNAGLAPSSSRSVSNFPLSGGGLLTLYNEPTAKGAFGISGLAFATTSASFVGDPFDFSGGATIGSSFSGTWASTGSSLFVYGNTSPDFGADSYLGFRTSQGNYGWMEATWNGTDFQFYSAAYEDVVGASIVAGDTGSAAAVPEIDPNGLASALSLVMGSAAMLEQRRRKRAAVAAAAVTA